MGDVRTPRLNGAFRPWSTAILPSSNDWLSPSPPTDMSDMDVGRKTYDRLWRDCWGSMQGLGPVHRHIREDLIKRVRSLGVDSILDVGCGSGDNLAVLALLGVRQLAGIDISDEALKRARDRVAAAQLSFLDIERAALPQQFELVISVQVLEHLLND